MKCKHILEDHKGIILHKEVRMVKMVFKMV